MRMSCNGCRVLRKGCGEDCSIRPCLSWIESSESQSNATLFLAKFYGRAGLLNLLNSGEDRFRPAMFRSLLHEACGRIVNPIYGSVGLLWSGKWHLCQAAVQAVLNGNPITPIDAGATGGAAAQGPPMNFGDIRHVARDNKSIGSKRRRSTRSGDCSAVESHGGECSAVESGGGDFDRDGAWCADEVKPTSCESETESVLSTEEMGRAEVEEAQEEDGPDGRVGLELTLGFGPGPVKKRRVD